MRIVVLDGYVLTAGIDGLWKPLQSLGEVALYERGTPDEVVARSKGAHVLVTNKAVIDARVLAAAPELRLVAVTATGHDCVDVAACSAAGVSVCNVPEYGTEPVSQFVFALLLELCHQVGLHGQAVQTGVWTNQPDFSVWQTPQVSLSGKTLGIVGPGRIGRRVGEIAALFGMTVMTHGRGGTRADLDELFRRADVVTLHCPLTPDTAGLVNRERLSLMKPGAFLINTSRGGLVVEADLADALRRGVLAGAALDVVSKEPIRPDNVLLGVPNCLVTPHIAWATDKARQQLLDTTVENIRNFLAGAPQNLVNRPTR